MNDFSEIIYGLKLIEDAFAADAGKLFRDAVDKIYPDTIKQVNEQLNDWRLDWQYETYITCVSIHDASEDAHGRLSMWRAYGDIALVLKNTPMLQVTDRLGVNSLAVIYQSLDQYKDRLVKVSEAITANHDYLKGLGQEVLISYIYHMLFHVAIASKHPGFSEEKEWRVFHRPYENPSSKLKKKTVVLGGVPQTIWVLPLEHDPDNGLFHADLPSLIDRVIIGPTEHSYISIRAFTELLEAKGVEDAGQKVIASDIPLRKK